MSGGGAKRDRWGFKVKVNARELGTVELNPYTWLRSAGMSMNFNRSQSRTRRRTTSELFKNGDAQMLTSCNLAFLSSPSDSDEQPGLRTAVPGKCF